MELRSLAMIYTNKTFVVLLSHHETGRLCGWWMGSDSTCFPKLDGPKQEIFWDLFQALLSKKINQNRINWILKSIFKVNDIFTLYQWLGLHLSVIQILAVVRTFIVDNELFSLFLPFSYSSTIPNSPPPFSKSSFSISPKQDWGL